MIQPAITNGNKPQNGICNAVTGTPSSSWAMAGRKVEEHYGTD